MNHRALTSDRDPSPHEAARRRELARLLPLWPHEVADLSAEGRKRIIRLLRKALKAERKRGIEAHWAYDLARHATLLRLYKSEQRAASRLPDRTPPSHPRPRHSIIKAPYTGDSSHTAS